MVFDAGYPCKLSRSPRGPLEEGPSITLMLYRQSLGLLSVLDRRLTVVYLPAPCPLDVPAYDVSQGTRLIQAGHTNARSFLSELSCQGPRYLWASTRPQGSFGGSSEGGGSNTSYLGLAPVSFHSEVKGFAWSCQQSA